MNVFIFPGQGAQFPGMGLDAYKSSKKIKSVFDEADEIFMQEGNHSSIAKL